MKHRQTLAEFIAETRPAAAAIAWARGLDASRLRHAAVAAGRPAQARRLADVKLRCVRRAVQVDPVGFRVTVDRDRYVGLVSVRSRRLGWVHLPADAELGEPGPADATRRATHHAARPSARLG